MQVVSSPNDMRSLVRDWQRAGERVGFVPTMGYLHAGHLSLVERARRECARVVVSIFVNPTQFGPGEDFTRYPRNEAQDLALCRDGGVAAVFLPTVEEMYPTGFRTVVEVAGLSEVLCGEYRPGHFRGVCTVVAKLFHLVPAEAAYLGQKDAQQALIIRRMAADLNFPVEVVVCPTVREADGLALSSRNVYLSAEERAAAPALYQSLRAANEAFRRGAEATEELLGIFRAQLAQAEKFQLQYVAVVDADNLGAVPTAQRGDLLAAAALLGRTRLIDNLFLGEQARNASVT